MQQRIVTALPLLVLMPDQLLEAHLKSVNEIKL